MRIWLPRRPLSGPEVVGVVVVAFFVLPLLVAGFLSVVTAISTWPAVIGLVAGGVGALIVQRTLTREVTYGRQRIAELERENVQLREQVDRLDATVDEFIDPDAPTG